jgi:NAD(P)-dependent dehydrogenase (short-subunit alcohol dehydrogenase family)
MEITLKDKVVVISGGTKGLGRALAEEACAAGAKVVIGGRDLDDGNKVVKLIKEKYDGNIVFVNGCLKNIDNCKKLIETAMNEYGQIDGLVNYAGITSTATLIETTEELFDNIFAINFKAAFFCSKYALEEMIKRGGSIVHVASTHAYGGDMIRAAYGCSKGSMLTLSKHIAKNYAKYQIRSNAIIMGWSATPNEITKYKSWGHDQNDLNEKGKSIIPMGRLQENEDFVPGILYLLSDSSRHLTDSEICINGGFWPHYGE